MSFADWKNRSKVFSDMQRRLNQYSEVTELCRAAYKAGERDGRKQVEEIAKRAFECLDVTTSKFLKGEK